MKSRIFIIIALLASVAFAAKKPKPPLPSYCTANGICLTHLRWEEDPTMSSRGTSAMTIFGTFENRSGVPVGNIGISFPLMNSRDSIVRTADVFLNSTIQSGVTWEFKTLTGFGEGIMAMDVLYTKSASVTFEDSEGRRTQTFPLPTVFNAFEGFAAGRWRKSHPGQ